MLKAQQRKKSGPKNITVAPMLPSQKGVALVAAIAGVTLKL